MKFIEKTSSENEDENGLMRSSSFSSSQTNETSNEATELCMLLSKTDIQNLLLAHDQISFKFDEQKSHQQMQNKALMLEQQSQQQYLIDSSEHTNKGFELTNVNCTDFDNLIGQDQCDAGLVNNAFENSAHFENEQIIEQQVENSQFLSDEGRFLLNKAQHYSVDNLKLVNIEKPDAPLGATIRNRDGSIVIGRIVVGGAAEQSGLLHEDDEILEINNIPVRGKTINDVCDMLCNLQGIVSFLIIPNMNYEPTKLAIEQNMLKQNKMLHIRALFNYVPLEDMFIPCKELGLGFSKGDIIHIISQVS